MLRSAQHAPPLCWPLLHCAQCARTSAQTHPPAHLSARPPTLPTHLISPEPQPLCPCRKLADSGLGQVRATIVDGGMGALIEVGDPEAVMVSRRISSPGRWPVALRSRAVVEWLDVLWLAVVVSTRGASRQQEIHQQRFGQCLLRSSLLLLPALALPWP